MVLKNGGLFKQKLSGGDTVSSRIGEVVLQGETAYQSYGIWESKTLGKCLVIDGDLRSSQLDLDTYHEALVHPAMLAHGEPRKVLILGGVDGATAFEVLRYPCVKEVVMVDVDRELVNVCFEYLPEWHRGGFDDPRLEMRFENIFKFVTERDEKFDVIICDLPDSHEEVEPGKAFHSVGFYTLLKGLISAGGLLSTQAGALALFDLNTHKQVREKLGEVFANTRSSMVAHDSFFVPWSFVVAFDTRFWPETMLASSFQQGLERHAIELSHFDSESLAASFTLAKRIKAELK